jgi:hypothetical protein
MMPSSAVAVASAAGAVSCAKAGVAASAAVIARTEMAGMAVLFIVILPSPFLF